MTPNSLSLHFMYDKPALTLLNSVQQHQHLLLSCFGNYHMETPAGEAQIIKLRPSEIKVLPIDSSWCEQFHCDPYSVLQLERLANCLTRTEFYKAPQKKCKITVWINALSPSLFSLYCLQASKYPTKLWDRMENPWGAGGELLETNTQTSTLLSSACECMICIIWFVPLIFFTWYSIYCLKEW